MPIATFLTALEQELENQFLENGFVILPCEQRPLLIQLQNAVTEEANNWILKHTTESRISHLKDSHQSVSTEIVNGFRLHLFAWLNSNPRLRFEYFSLASSALQSLVGNELAMQNKVNLSIQHPGDHTSVLETHSDVWSGDSPFQVVLWIPLTDSKATNAMFFLRPKLTLEAYKRTLSGELKSMSDVQKVYEEDFQPIEVKFGDVLIFDSSCLHGNQFNSTDSSRWSLNCRFTSLLAPAITPERRLGPYYTPITIRPATKMGLRATEALRLLD